MPDTTKPYPPASAPVVNEQRLVTAPWLQYWTQLWKWAASILPINLADATQVTNRLPYANQPQVAASHLLGRGSAGGTGDVEPIALGSGLLMTGTTLSASGVTPPFVLLTADPGSPTDDTWWAVRTGTTPTGVVAVKARIGGTTILIAAGSF